MRVALSVYRGNPYCGGQGVYVRHLSAALAQLGHEVTVFSGQPYPELANGIELVKIPSLDLYREPDPFRRPKIREFESLADVLEVATMLTGGFPEPRTFSLRLLDALAARRGDFDIVHDDQSLGTALLDLEELGFPVVASVHHPVSIDRSLDLAAATHRSKRLSLMRWYGFAKMQARVARLLRGVLTVSSNSACDVVSEMGVDPSHLHIVPVGVDTSVWRPIPEIARVSGRIMTTASSDVPLKGLAVLLEAIAKVRVEHNEVHLVVVGRLRPQSPVAELIKERGLQDAVSFVSGESDEELVARYASASIAVVPSLYEGFSLPAIEAMACEVPLVTSDGGALPEVVGTSGDAALVVRAGDVEALKSAIDQLLASPVAARELGRRGRERVAACFTWQQTAMGTIRAYHDALRDPPC
jgi:glycosyltransferase involved in cell wall biosynthesis